MGSIVLLILSACGSQGASGSPQPPHDVTITVSPASITLAPGQLHRFTATVLGTDDRRVDWSAPDGLVSVEGETVLFTAPEGAGAYELTATSRADVNRSATAAVSVVGASVHDVSQDVGNEGGMVDVGSGAIVAFPGGALRDEANVRVRAYQMPPDPEAPRLENIGLQVIVEIPVGSLNLDDREQVLYVAVPGELTSGLAEDATTAARVEITFDYTTTYNASTNYRPEVEDAVAIPLSYLADLIQEYGTTPDNVTIAVQPVGVATQLVPGSLEAPGLSHGITSRAYGLFRLNIGADFTKAKTLCGSNREDATWPGFTQISGPVTPAGGRTPLVLVHGWQTLGQSDGKKSAYHPAMCAWLDYLPGLQSDSELKQKYELYSFSYDSDGRVLESVSALEIALRRSFGDQKVVLIGHSMGGMLANTLIQRTGSAQVHHSISLGTPYRGSRALLCEEGGSNGTYCNRVRTIAIDVGTLFIEEVLDAAGTKDLAWEFGGVEYSVSFRCDGGTFGICNRKQVSDANPFLERTNANLVGGNYRNYNALVGEVGFWGQVRGLGAGSKAIETVAGMKSDGIVPTQSACLSTSRSTDNSCSDSIFGSARWSKHASNHMTITGMGTLSEVKSVLNDVWPGVYQPSDPEPPVEPGVPEAFALQPAVPYCTDALQPAIRLNWTASAGAQAYEIHRDGALYASPKTLSTTFENTANVTAGQAYAYFVRATNEAGTRDSNIRTVTVPMVICDEEPTVGADLIISGLTVTPTAAQAGFAVTVSFSVTNQGDATAGASTARIRINTNPTNVTTSDTLLEELSIPAIGAGSAQTYNQSVTLPPVLPDGTYYVWVTADVFNQAGQVDYQNDRAVRNLTIGEPIGGVTASANRLSTGYYYSLAVGGDGTVWAWGRNEYGELGNGSTTDSLRPVQVDGLRNINSVAAGHSHSLALDEAGRVWAWGRGDRGALGTGTPDAEPVPRLVMDIENVVGVAAGNSFSLGLKEDGTVWHWGISVGWAIDEDEWTPVQVSGLRNISKIVAGNVHSIALDEYGTVWTWGWNQFGQLGDGTLETSVSPQSVTSLGTVVDIGAGEYTSYALMEDGSVWTWGLLNGKADFSETPVPLADLSSIRRVTTGDYHSLALRGDGTVWSWGSNYYGQLGDGTTTDSATPVRVISIPTATDIAAGIYQSLALAEDGTFWAWGGNEYGQVGDGSTVDRHTPVQILGIP